jgi:hypothetical protein
VIGHILRSLCYCRCRLIASIVAAFGRACRRRELGSARGWLRLNLIRWHILLGAAERHICRRYGRFG